MSNDVSKKLMDKINAELAQAVPGPLSIDEYVAIRVEKEVARMKEYPYGYFKKPNFPNYKKNKKRKKK